MTTLVSSQPELVRRSLTLCACVAHTIPVPTAEYTALCAFGDSTRAVCNGQCGDQLDQSLPFTEGSFVLPQPLIKNLAVPLQTMFNASTSLPRIPSLTIPFHILVAAVLGLIPRPRVNFALLHCLHLLSPKTRTWYYIASFPVIRQLLQIYIVRLLQSTDALVELQIPMVLAGSLERIFEAASRQSGTFGLRKLILVQSVDHRGPEVIFHLLSRAEFERILIGGLEHFDSLHDITIPYHFLTQELVWTLSRLENLRKLTIAVPTYQGMPEIPVVREWVEEMRQMTLSQDGFSSLVELDVCSMN